jgi:prevent-host-death family protein
MMATISATEANREFSKLLRRANAGETITITSHGRPYALLAPPGGAVASVDETKRLVEAQRRLVEHLDRQTYLRLGRFQRDWAYDD